MVPVMCCLAAGGIGTIGKMIRLQQSKRLAVVTGLVFTIVLLPAFSGPFPEEKVNYEAELYYGLGGYALQSGEIDRAIGHYKTAVRLNPDFDAAYNNLGAALAKRGELEKAISYFKKALEIEPKNIKAHSNIARALMRQGNPSAAIDHLKEALKLAPWSAQLHNRLVLAVAEL